MPVTRVRIKRRGGYDFRSKSAKGQLLAQIGMRQLLEDIHKTSRPITPKLTGDLRGDVEKKVTKIGDTIRGVIHWKRPYSWYQERGYTSGPVTRYTTPGTSAHFAAKSVKKVTSTKRANRYFGKKI